MISQGVPISGSAAPDFREWRTRNHVFEGMVAYTYENYNLALPGEDSSRVQGAAVSPETFRFWYEPGSRPRVSSGRRTRGTPPLCPPEATVSGKNIRRASRMFSAVNLHMGSADTLSSA